MLELSPERPSERVVDEIDRERASDLGIDITGLANTMQAMLDGNDIGDVYIGDRSFGVKLVSTTNPINDPTDLENIFLKTQDGRYVPMSTIATLSERAVPPDESEVDHCGTCRACLDICPTDAFPAPRQLDARRCISYLTIEHAGPIAREFRIAMGNRVYGYDDCLAVCPWNKFAQAAREAAFAPRESLTGATLVELAAIDDATFRARFSGSAIKRMGHERFVRNIAIALGNSDGGEDAVAAVMRLLDDPSATIRGAAVWALGRLSLARFDAERIARLTAETDESVRTEWASI